MHFSQRKDERIFTFSENVRRQVDIEKSSGVDIGLPTKSVKEQAERLRDEMDRQRLLYTGLIGHGMPRQVVHTFAHRETQKMHSMSNPGGIAC